ncbi:MAG: DUF3795 domain-containing protein [Dehalococcoidia bacterium]|jgi:predicted RNA-binding Zn-ribbon protein involved in translation (DUF1610 family)
MKNTGNYDKSTSAVCGLFCPACTLYIGTQEDPQRLQFLADRFKLPLEEVRCGGCRSELRSFYCRQMCYMYRCADEKGIEFCGSCESYPCRELKDFQCAMPHRIELWSSLDRIREAGPEVWYAEMLQHYACPACGTINSAYDFQCRKCGNEPGSAYVADHKDEIIRQLGEMK